MRDVSTAEPIDLSQVLAPGNLLRRLPGLLGSFFHLFRTQMILPLIVGLSIAAIVYGLLPMVGVEQFSQLLEFKKVFLLCFAIAGGVFYWIFLDYIKRRPSWLLMATFIGLPWLTWFSNLTLTNGVNIYKNVWLMGGICAPAIYLSWPYLSRIWQRLPFFKYFVLYVAIAAYFYAFNNHLVFDQRFTEGSQPISFHAFFTSIYHLLTLVLVGASVLLESRPRKIFDTMNMIVLWMTFIYAVVSLVAYPFQIFAEFLEGVWRTRFIFMFTNEYSFYMEFLVTYLLGIYFYNFETREKDTNTRFPWQVMYPVTIVLGALAMITSFTKTSIGVFFLAVAIIFVCNIPRVLKQKVMLVALAAFPVVMVVGALIFQVTTDTDIMANIDARMNNTDSMTWREHVIDYLMDDMSPVNYITGHGFSASNERMQLFEKFTDMDDSTANSIQVLAVHNSYLSQLYDFGLGGIMLMIVLAIYSLQTGWRLLWQQCGTPAIRAIDTTLFAMMVTYLILCGVNNTFDMIQLPFWILLSILFLTRYQLSKQALSPSSP